MVKTFCCLILFLFVVSVEGQGALENEEYAVYRSVLNEEFIGSSSKMLVIYRFTEFEPVGRRKVSDASKEAIKSYVARGKASSEVSDLFRVRPIVQLITEEDLKSVWREDRADLGESFKRAFLAKFSADFSLQFSRVGFNKKRDRALVHVGYTCGPTCGEGNFYVLEKLGAWKVKKKIRTWIS